MMISVDQMVNTPSKWNKWPKIDWMKFLKQRRKHFGKIFSHFQPGKTFKDDSYKKDDFDFIYIIGTGAFGKVYLAVLKTTGKKYAIKAQERLKIARSNQAKRFVQEIRILQAIDFPFCIHLEMSFQCPRYHYLVLPYLAGGDMFENLREMRKFPEQLSKFYGAQVVLALEYLHFLKIAHRDVKPENIVLERNGYIKLTDFGLCKKLRNKRSYTFCGTPEYLAPEIVLHMGHGKSVDWWSFGCLLFEMSAGSSPFYAPDIMAIYENIATGNYTTPDHFSDELADLVGNLIQVNLSKRYGNLKNGTDDIKYHPWFNSIDWTALFNYSIPAPYKPPTNSETDIKLAMENILPESGNSEEFKDF